MEQQMMIILTNIWSAPIFFGGQIKLLIENAQSWKYFYKTRFIHACPSLTDIKSNCVFFKYNYALIIIMAVGLNVLVDGYLWWILFPVIGMYLFYDKSKGLSQLFSWHHISLSLIMAVILYAVDLQRLQITLLSVGFCVCHALLCRRFRIPVAQTRYDNRNHLASRSRSRSATYMQGNNGNIRHIQQNNRKQSANRPISATYHRRINENVLYIQQDNRNRSRTSYYRQQENGADIVIFFLICILIFVAFREIPSEINGSTLSVRLNNICPVQPFEHMYFEKCYVYENETLINGLG